MTTSNKEICSVLDAFANHWKRNPRIMDIERSIEEFKRENGLLEVDVFDLNDNDNEDLPTYRKRVIEMYHNEPSVEDLNDFFKNKLPNLYGMSKKKYKDVRT